MLKDGRLDRVEMDMANQTRYSSMPMASKLIQTIEEDSDDALENFHSEQWGAGASKVIAEHYHELQKNRDKSMANTKNQKLTTEDFKKLIAVMQACRGMKKQAKQQGAYIDIQRKELEVLVSAQKDEVDELTKMVKQI